MWTKFGLKHFLRLIGNEKQPDSFRMLLQFYNAIQCLKQVLALWKNSGEVQNANGSKSLD